MDREDARALLHRFRTSVAYVAVENREGDLELGSAFHLGGGLFATARHVVEHGVRELGVLGPDDELPLRATSIDQPLWHPDDNVDIALVQTGGIDCPAIPLADEANSCAVLDAVLLLGFPRVPLAADPPPLIAATAEVNGRFDLYLGSQPTLVLSTTARGGFSGGVVISSAGSAVGILTRSLVREHQPTELGFLSAAHIEAVRTCARANRVALPQQPEE